MIAMVVANHVSARCARSGLAGSPASAGRSWCPLGTMELLHQVDVVVAVRVAGGAAAFGVAEPGVETGCLEGVGTQGHPVAAAASDLGFGCGEEPGAQSATALAVVHPEQVDVAAAAPGPAVEPRVQVTIVAADRDRQQAAVMVAGGGGVEGADLFLKAVSQASVGLADGERYLVHHCLLPGKAEGRWRLACTPAERAWGRRPGSPECGFRAAGPGRHGCRADRSRGVARSAGTSIPAG